MDTTANDLDREAHHDWATLGSVARSAPRRARVHQLEVGHAQRQIKEALEAADRYVRDQPWEAIGIAAIAGLAMGLLLGRR